MTQADLCVHTYVSCADDLVITFSSDGVLGVSDDGITVTAGGVGKRGKGVSTGGVKIGIAMSSGEDAIGDSCRVVDLTSCTS